MIVWSVSFHLILLYSLYHNNDDIEEVRKKVMVVVVMLPLCMITVWAVTGLHIDRVFNGTSCLIFAGLLAGIGTYGYKIIHQLKVMDENNGRVQGLLKKVARTNAVQTALPGRGRLAQRAAGLGAGRDLRPVGSED